METHVKLKVLFRKYAAGLLELTGDAGSEVLSAEVVELQDFKRSVDCLLKLRPGQEVYYRHVELQEEADPAMPERCFRYNTQLVLPTASNVGCRGRGRGRQASASAPWRPGLSLPATPTPTSKQWNVMGAALTQAARDGAHRVTGCARSESWIGSRR